MIVVETAFAAVLAAVIIMIAAVVLRARSHGGFRLAFYGQDILYKRTCLKCSAGIQYQAGDGSWGPAREPWAAGLPTAPHRDCKACNGMGFFLDAAEHVTLPPPAR